LTDKRGNKNGRLSIRVTEQLTSVAVSALEQVRAAGKKLLLAPVTKVLEDTTGLNNPVPKQRDIETSIRSLLGKLEILIKVGDQVAKVCLGSLCSTLIALRLLQINPYVNFAWQVLSAALKVWQFN